MGVSRRARIAVLVLAVLGAFLYLPGLGETGLWDPWEPKYAQAPREMAQRGDWVVPYFQLEPRLNKPPLTYWLIGASQSIFGVTEFAARLPSALLAILCPIALALAFAVRGRETEGFLAGAALLTIPQWALLGRFATPDIPLATALGIALAAVVASGAAETKRARLALGSVAVAAVVLAGLTDGTRGLVLPAWAGLAWGALRLRWPWALALVVGSLLYYIGQDRYSVPLNVAAIAVVVLGAMAFGRYDLGVRWRSWAVVLAVIAVLVIPWFVVAYERAGPEEMSLFKYKHALNLGEAKEYHRASLHKVTRLVAGGGLPWSAAAVAGLLLAFRRRDPDDLAALFGGAFLGPLLFFSLAEAKMGHFTGLMQPAVAALAAIGIVAFLRRADWRWIPAFAALLLVGWAAWKDPSRILETATVKRSLYGFDLAGPLVLALVGWLALIVAAKLGKRPRWSVACVGPPLLFVALLGMRMLPALEEQKSMKPIWNAYLADREDTDEIAMTGSIKFGCSYYSDNQIARLESSQEFREFFGRAEGRYLIVSKKTYRKQLEPARPEGWEVVHDRHSTHLLVRFVRPGE